MRLVLILPLLGLGCAEDPPRGPAVDSHVEFYDFVQSDPPELDLLIVVDHTAAMAPYQVALAAVPSIIEAALTDANGAQPDVRIAVTTVDGAGAFRQPSATTDPYLALGYNARYERAANYTGTLAAALAPMLDVGATASVTPQPLTAAKAALDAQPGFLRSTAALGILTITASDDGSSAPVTDYATGLKNRKYDPSDIAVSSVYPMSATRLDAFHAEFPNHSFTLDIATANFAPAIEPLGNLLTTVLGHPCPFEPADVDAVTTGPQYDCDLNAYYEDGTTQRIRQCKMDPVEPCFVFMRDPGMCMTAGTARFYVVGFPTRWHPAIRGQCVVTGQN